MWLTCRGSSPSETLRRWQIRFLCHCHHPNTRQTEMRLYVRLQVDLLAYDRPAWHNQNIHLTTKQVLQLYTTKSIKLPSSQGTFCVKALKGFNLSSHQGYSKHLLKPLQLICDAAASVSSAFPQFFFMPLPVATWSSLHLGMTHLLLCSPNTVWPSNSLQDSSHSLFICYFFFLQKQVHLCLHKYFSSNEYL